MIYNVELACTTPPLISVSRYGSVAVFLVPVAVEIEVQAKGSEGVNARAWRAQENTPPLKIRIFNAIDATILYLIY